jgi:hypothetical protein
MEFPAQVILTVSQIFWCRDVVNCLRSRDPIHSLEQYRDLCVEKLERLAGTLMFIIHNRIINNKQVGGKKFSFSG